LACTAKHPALTEALRVMLLYYDGEFALGKGQWMGTTTLFAAFHSLPEVDRGKVGHA
jgi:hypothetical protein